MRRPVRVGECFQPLQRLRARAARPERTPVDASSIALLALRSSSRAAAIRRGSSNFSRLLTASLRLPGSECLTGGFDRRLRARGRSAFQPVTGTETGQRRLHQIGGSEFLEFMKYRIARRPHLPPP